MFFFVLMFKISLLDLDRIILIVFFLLLFSFFNNIAMQNIVRELNFRFVVSSLIFSFIREFRSAL